MMGVITFDIPLLIIGLLSLIWLRFFSPAHVFQVACQFFGTFWAQHSFVISWSLGKLIPFLSASSTSAKGVRFAALFMPFIVYVVVVGAVSSIFWRIPSDVSFAYGEGRFWIQLAIFVSTVLSTKAFAAAMLHRDGPILLWKALTVAIFIHAVASLYQYLAVSYGLPVIGISRAHGETLEAGMGDIAAFSTDGGAIVFRPGGLAGEPKTAAFLYGVHLFAQAIAGTPSTVSQGWRRLARCVLLLSGICYIGAFSTSIFIGAFFALLFFVILVASKKSLLNIGYFLVIATALLVLAFYLLSSFLNFDLFDLLLSRSVDRVLMGEMDPPVAAAISIFSNNIVVFFVGTGLGGGTFPIMEYLNTVYKYAISPNVGLVLLLLEFGVIGISLLMAPFLLLTFRVARFIRGRSRRDALATTLWSATFLWVVGVVTMCFTLTSSGISLGFPLSIGCILAAAHVSRVSQRGLVFSALKIGSRPFAA